MSEIEPTKRELAWLKRLQKLIDSQPPNTWVYVDSGTVTLMRLGPDGDRVMAMNGESFAHEAIIGSIIPKQDWDGGDW